MFANWLATSEGRLLKKARACSEASAEAFEGEMEMVGGVEGGGVDGAGVGSCVGRGLELAS